MQPGGGQRVQTSPVKQQQQRSISPVQPAYHPNSPYIQRQQPSQYPPPRPNLQVQVTAPANPFVDPPRAAFAAPPSPTLSSTDSLSTPKNLLHSPSTQTLNGGSAVSRTDPDNDRLAPARIVGDGQDFWKRFSMVAHEAEMEKRVHPETSTADPWLSKQFRGTRKFQLSVWAIGLVCVAAIAGGLAWHFTHNTAAKLTQPTQHDFGLGGTSSVARSGINGAAGGGTGVAPQAGATTTAPVAVPAAARTTSAIVPDADTNIAAADNDEDVAPQTTALAPATTTRRAVVTTSSTPLAAVDEQTLLATSTRIRGGATTTSSISIPARSALVKRMHKHQRRLS